MADKKFQIAPFILATGGHGQKAYVQNKEMTLESGRRPVTRHEDGNLINIKVNPYGHVEVYIEFSSTLMVGYDGEGKRIPGAPEWTNASEAAKKLIITKPQPNINQLTSLNSNLGRDAFGIYAWMIKPLDGMTPEQTKDMVINHISDQLGIKPVRDRDNYNVSFIIERSSPSFQPQMVNLRAMTEELLVPNFDKKDPALVDTKETGLRSLANMVGVMTGKSPYSRWDKVEVGSYEKANADKDINLHFNPYVGVGAKEVSKKAVIDIKGLDRKHVAALTDMVEARGNNFTIEKGELIVDQQKTGMFSWEPLDGLVNDLNRGIEKLRQNGEEKIKIPATVAQSKPANVNTAAPVNNPATGKPVPPPSSTPVKPGVPANAVRPSPSVATTPVVPPRPAAKAPPSAPVPPAAGQGNTAPPPVKKGPPPLPSSLPPLPKDIQDSWQGAVTGVTPRRTPPSIPGAAQVGQPRVGGAAPTPQQMANYLNSAGGYTNVTAVPYLKEQFKAAVDLAKSVLGEDKAKLAVLKDADLYTQVAFIDAMRSARAPRESTLTGLPEPQTPAQLAVSVKATVNRFTSDLDAQKTAFLSRVGTASAARGQGGEGR